MVKDIWHINFSYQILNIYYPMLVLSLSSKKQKNIIYAKNVNSKFGETDVPI